MIIKKPYLLYCSCIILAVAALTGCGRQMPAPTPTQQNISPSPIEAPASDIRAPPLCKAVKNISTVGNTTFFTLYTIPTEGQESEFYDIKYRSKDSRYFAKALAYADVFIRPLDLQRIPERTGVDYYDDEYVALLGVQIIFFHETAYEQYYEEFCISHPEYADTNVSDFPTELYHQVIDEMIALCSEEELQKLEQDYMELPASDYWTFTQYEIYDLQLNNLGQLTTEEITPYIEQ